MTTATRYCDPACTVNAAETSGVVRNAVDCPAPASVALRIVAGSTVSVRFTDWGLFVTPETADMTGTVAVYDPTARLPVDGINVIVAGAVVAFKLAASQPVG